ncbi:unnamed protein product [Rotaria sp. Silwood2]|nr:unnamed protein product [Rotaria sp. Silwood2]
MNLCLLNRKHFEQYCLSLDHCQQFKQIIDDTNMINGENSLFITWNEIPFKRDRLTIDHQHGGWKPYASRRDIELFKRDRIGNDELNIIPMSFQSDGSWFLEECGMMHLFSGRVCLVSENSNTILATFIVDNLRLNEGKWYYCVRLLESNFLQIGWATTGFNPNGPNIRINFWLNGHFLGTVFEHNCAIGSKLCNMLSNGCDASYFPGVSLKVNDFVTLNSCEFIFSLEDMLECPLPLGYKPFVDTELDNDQDNIYKVRSNRSTIFLCDFVDSQRLETEFRFENQQLVLQHDKNGLLLTIDHCESWTISFDFQLLDKFDNHDFILLTFDDTLETFSIRIPTSKICNQTQITIVYYSNKREIKIYIDNEYQLVECPSMISYNIYILPLIAAGLENVAI